MDDDRRREDSGPSLGEVVRRLDKIDGRFDKVDSSIDSLKSDFVSQAVYEAHREADAEKLKETHRLAVWALGLIGTAVFAQIVMAVMGARPGP